MASKELLVSPKDFAQYKNISVNTNTTKDLEPYILEAQRIDIEPFLGSALYYDLINTYPYPNVTGAEAQAAYDDAILAGETPPVNYTPLVNGETYINDCGDTAAFYGLKLPIIYFAYARYIRNLPNRVVRHGIVKQSSTYSEPLNDGQIQKLENESKSIALKYLKDTHEYLCAKREEYPLYKGYSENKVNRSIRIRSSNGLIKYPKSGDNAKFRLY